MIIPLAEIPEHCRESALAAGRSDGTVLRIRREKYAAACRDKTVARKPSGEWPDWAKGVALLATPEDIGVGDTVERWARKFGGIQFKAMSKAIGMPCRCDERRAEWNRRYPY